MAKLTGAHLLVRCLKQEGIRRVFTIVGEDEADTEGGKVSWVSPLAGALRGARLGDSVTWKRPSGDLELEIVSIEYAKNRTANPDAGM